MRHNTQSTRNVVLVTGAGSGMGLETALHLAALGYRVFGSVRTPEEHNHLRAAAEARELSLEILRFDVTRDEEARPEIARMHAATGQVDALVQFAGIGLRGFFEDLGLDEIERVFQINLFGLMRVTQLVLPYMRKARRGHIILTSSVGGRMGSMSIAGYASSKFAIEGWAECLRQEMACFGVHVSLLEPGLIRTPHFDVHRNPARRAVDPGSPYYTWFCRHEALVDRLLSKGSFTTADIAHTVARILRSPRPRLRYVVGAKAKWIFALRRYIPGEWFESVYWGVVRRMVTRPAATPSADRTSLGETV